MTIKKTHIGLEFFGRVKHIVKIHELENGDFIKEYPYGTGLKLDKIDRKQLHELTINYYIEFHEKK